MPRNVRNFWIELEVDGKKTKIATGPRSKNGGFQMEIKVRHNGEVKKALTLKGDESNGVLGLKVTPLMGESRGIYLYLDR